jgi:hypothetical protein
MPTPLYKKTGDVMKGVRHMPIPPTKNMRCNEGGLAYTYPPPLKNMRCNEGGPAYANPPYKKHEM